MANAKKPQDHKPKQNDAHAELETPLEERAGYEFLHPVHELSSGDKLLVLGTLQDCGLIDDEGQPTNKTPALRDLAHLNNAFMVSPAVADEAGYRAFDRTANPTDVAELVCSYAGELGKAIA